MPPLRLLVMEVEEEEEDEEEEDEVFTNSCDSSSPRGGFVSAEFSVRKDVFQGRMFLFFIFSTVIQLQPTVTSMM